MLTRPALLAVLLTLALASTAPAATKHGVTPLAPKAGSLVPAGQSLTFRLRVKGRGQVWVHVCKSAHKSRSGIICSKESIGRAKRSNGVFKFTPKFFDFPEFWLNSPGTYYWQGFRIACEGKDCDQEGPVVKFKVAPA
ncbi:MAG: hypothetical protein M3O90_06555 [Actinomycetota bacterium]|nr:hypothetical protein [Actinomycetota bacterium]